MVIGYVLLAVAFAEFALGLYFLTRYKTQQSTFWFGLFCFGVAMYVATNGLGYMRNSFYIAERFGWVGGMLTAIFILPFSWTFPLPRKRIGEVLPFVIWPLVVFTPGILWTDIFLRADAIVDYVQGYQTAPGPYFWFMLMLFFVNWVWALGNMLYNFSRSDGHHRWMLKMLLIGLGLSLIVSVATDIIYPLVTVSKIGYIGSLFSAVWLGFTSYILLKR